MQKFQNLGNEILLEELKVLQMNVLTAVDEFCRNNNIRYSMACGTMLGAVRHKGYIPWDDDIDIYLFREDYKKLMELFPKIYKNHYCISSLDRDELWDKPYAKAYDNRTVVIENADTDSSYGVNIDIFPVDEVPDDELVWEKYDQKRRKLYKKYDKLFVHINLEFNLKCVLKWIYWSLPKLFVSRRRMAQKIDKNCLIWAGRNYTRVFECCQGIFQKRPFNKSLFDNIVDYPFEDRTYKGFENYDEYLRNGFGDYMQLPPIEKRITHHSYHAYWK